jgi:hypothetical protein
MKKSHLFGYCVFLSVGFSAMQFNSCSTTKKAEPCKECPHFTQQIDSVKNKITIDSVTIGIIEKNFDELWEERDLTNAMIQVESRGDDSAYCAKEEAVGCLQIRPIMLEEVNRILKRKGVEDRYALVDRWSREKSIEMLKVFTEYYKLNSSEEVARCWNGGPKGMTYASTKGYWNKVQNEMI